MRRWERDLRQAERLNKKKSVVLARIDGIVSGVIQYRQEMRSVKRFVSLLMILCLSCLPAASAADIAGNKGLTVLSPEQYLIIAFATV